MLAGSALYHGSALALLENLPGVQRHAALPGVSDVSRRKPRNMAASVRQRLFYLARENDEPYSRDDSINGPEK